MSLSSKEDPLETRNFTVSILPYNAALSKGVEPKQYNHSKYHFSNIRKNSLTIYNNNNIKI